MTQRRRPRYSKKQSPLQQYLPAAVTVAVAVALIVLVVVAFIPKNNSEPVPDTLFQNQMVPVQKEEGWQYVKLDGSDALAQIFQNAEPFGEEKLAPVCRDGKWGYIDLEGNMAIENIYDYVLPFHNGLAAVQSGTRWGFIAPNGIPVVSPAYESVGTFGEEGLAMIRENGKFGYINREGVVEIEPRFTFAGPFTKSLAMVQENGMYGFIRKDGSYAVEPVYSAAGYFAQNGLAPVCKDGRWGYVNQNGEMVIAPEFDFAYDFSPEGLAKVQVTGKFGYIDAAGNVVIEPVYSNADNFKEGYAVVVQDKKYALIDTQGKAVIGFGAAQYLNPVENGMVLFMDNTGNYGYMDAAGKIVIAPSFTQAQPFRADGYAVVQKDALWGVIRQDGTFLIAPAYEAIG